MHGLRHECIYRYDHVASFSIFHSISISNLAKPSLQIAKLTNLKLRWVFLSYEKPSLHVKKTRSTLPLMVRYHCCTLSISLLAPRAVEQKSPKMEMSILSTNSATCYTCAETEIETGNDRRFEGRLDYSKHTCSRRSFRHLVEHLRINFCLSKPASLTS